MAAASRWCSASLSRRAATRRWSLRRATVRSMALRARRRVGSVGWGVREGLPGITGRAPRAARSSRMARPSWRRPGTKPASRPSAAGASPRRPARTIGRRGRPAGRWPCAAWWSARRGSGLWPGPAPTPSPPAARRCALAWLASSISVDGGRPPRPAARTPHPSRRVRPIRRGAIWRSGFGASRAAPWRRGAFARRHPVLRTGAAPETTRRSSARPAPRPSLGGTGQGRSDCAALSRNGSPHLAPPKPGRRRNAPEGIRGVRDLGGFRPVVATLRG